MEGILLTLIGFVWPLLALIMLAYVLVTINVMGMGMPALSNKNDALEDAKAE